MKKIDKITLHIQTSAGTKVEVFVPDDEDLLDADPDRGIYWDINGKGWLDIVERQIVDGLHEEYVLFSVPQDNVESVDISWSEVGE